MVDAMAVDDVVSDMHHDDFAYDKTMLVAFVANRHNLDKAALHIHR